MSSWSQDEYRIAVFGPKGVGKSALVTRFVTDNFLFDYDSSIEDSYRKLATVDGQSVLLDILDAMSEPTGMNEVWMRDAKGFLLLYDITSRESFNRVSEYYATVMQDKSKIPIVLAGTKCDLESSRQVTNDEGAALANSWGVPFIETSAKVKINIDECFWELVRQIRSANKEEASQHRNKPAMTKLGAADTVADNACSCCTIA